MIPSRIPRVMLKSFPEEKRKALLERFSKLESRIEEQQKVRTCDFRYYSAPGRTELGGNHTDHNNGSVLASSVDFDMVAVVRPRTDTMVTLQSTGYPPISIYLDDTERKSCECGTPASIIRGFSNWLFSRGLPQCKGFDIAIDSEVPAGSGLSSSAAFEMLIAAMYDDIGNYGLSPIEWAVAGKYSENEYFGKPCGLMDQLACALGGIIFIDFANQENPRIETVAFDFAEFEYALAIVSTGTGHEDLTDEYASIPKEMKAVANVFGQSTLQGISSENLIKKIAKIRIQCGDRAFLRAWHFVLETERPRRMVNALQNRDLEAYLKLVKESGNSSWMYLQNVIGTQIAHQNLGIALAIAEKTIGEQGACRVHGGGFAGAIQAYLPQSAFQNFSCCMEEIFGHKSVRKIALRPFGVCKIIVDALK